MTTTDMLCMYIHTMEPTTPRVFRPDEARAKKQACLCSKLRRAARLVTQYYDEQVRLSGLAMAQFGLLGSLAAMRETTQAQLAEAMNLDSTTLTRTLAPLIARGWVEKAQLGKDRRERLLRITPLGLQQLRQAGTHWETAQQHMRQVLGEADWEQLHAILTRVIQAVQQK